MIDKVITFEMTFTESPQMTATFAETPLSVPVEFGEFYAVEAEDYEGPYEVTPTRQTQTLATEGKHTTANIVVNPIPNNYGLITWNGSTLTVS